MNPARPQRYLLLLGQVVLSSLLLTTGLVSEIPALLNYQGRVVVDGTNHDGPADFKFALVSGDGSVSYWSNDGTSEAGGEPLAGVSLTVTKGLYAVLLGDMTLPNMQAITPGDFEEDDVRLRVWFDDGVNGSLQLAPDQRIASVAYAMKAAEAGDLG